MSFLSDQQEPTKPMKKGAQPFPTMLKGRLKIKDFPPDKPVVFPQTSPILAVNNHTLNQLVPKLKEKMPFKNGGFFGKKKSGKPPSFQQVNKPEAKISVDGRISKLTSDNLDQKIKEPAPAPPPNVPLNVYETDYVTTTFRTKNMNLQNLAGDVVQELRAWTKDHFLVLAELQWCCPLESEQFSLTAEDESQVKKVLEDNLEKLNNSHGKGLLEPQLSSDGIVALRNDMHLGMYRTYAEMLQHLRHKDAEKKHGKVWSFNPKTVSWGKILGRLQESKLACTILDLNLICLRLTDSFLPPRNGFYAVKNGFSNGKLALKIVNSDLPPQIPRAVILPTPKVHHKVKTITKPSKHLPRVVQTRYITVTFEVLDRGLNTLEGEILAEIQKWTKEGSAVCVEVIWSSPEKHKELKTEHGIRGAIRAIVVPAKWKVCKVGFFTVC